MVEQVRMILPTGAAVDPEAAIPFPGAAVSGDLSRGGESPVVSFTWEKRREPEDSRAGRRSPRLLPCVVNQTRLVIP
ncbi:hypothetical protein [Streptomyces sp. NPDC002588]|uniref:hypothetical protein n=1 Tax=Streptomyces sp. NPDC002588 TaxID=3154419 RepID=UPI003332EABA